ncbi:WhiB family transcriptional regulator [Bifidobacterium longum]|uniref:WhiB family transcriptional regulator n=1 Tax=Bifidobacterium longum TaxID=216816 RepID=UPI003CCC8DC8
MDWRHQAACRDHDPELWFSGKPYEQAAALAICRSCPVIGECRRPPTSTTGSTATSCRASGAAADTGSNDDPRKDQQ